MGFAVHPTLLLFGLLLLLPGDLIADASGGMPDGPLRVRNVSPIMQLYGVPRSLGADVVRGHTEASFNIEIANNFQSESRRGTFAFFDGETYVSSYRLRGGFADNWEWGIEVPYVVHTPGSFDGVVDEFHELFGLPDGERSLAVRGRLDYLLRSNGVVYADFSDSRRALGDVRAFLGLQMYQDSRSTFAVRTQVKMPTGDVADLTGSKGTDVALWGEYQYTMPLSAREIRVTVSGGVTRLGKGELIPHAQETWLQFGHIGIQMPIHPRVEFHAQLDGHTRALDTGNPLVADGGILGTLGSRIGLTERLWMDLALIEDLDNESASDVVFQIMIGSRL